MNRPSSAILARRPAGSADNASGVTGTLWGCRRTSSKIARAGAIARFSPIMREVAAHAKRGGIVLGICNGFQIACEAHLLPGALLRNDRGYRAIPVTIRVEQTNTPFTAAALAMGFRSSGYQSQIFRGAILSVPNGRPVPEMSTTV